MQPPPPRPPRAKRPPISNTPYNHELPKASFPDRETPARSECPPPCPARSESIPLNCPVPNNLPFQLPPEDLTPRPWTDCFENLTDIPLPIRGGTWRTYDAGLSTSSNLAIIFLHGGGHAALSWGLVATHLKTRCTVVAFDARGHGDTHTNNDFDLSADTQVQDAAALVHEFFASGPLPRIVLCGHSMGGAVAVRLAASSLLPIVGLVVIDVVEGTAMPALPYMASWLRNRPSEFTSVEKAIRYITRAGHVRNTESARVSVRPQLSYNPDSKRWMWRTRLEESNSFWKGWFEGLSSLFLSVSTAKMLVLANLDRLDKDLMIAQMQGKFQNILIPTAGHAVHEDQPDQTARALLDFLERNMFLPSVNKDRGTSVYQQKGPIPPCC